MQICELKVAYCNIKNHFELSNLSKTKEIAPSKGHETLQIGDTIVTGFYTRLFKMLLKNLNFTIKWVYAESNTMGVRNDTTGEWNGVIGLLNKSMADVSAFPLSVRPIRKTAVGYSTSFETYEYRLFMKHPDQSFRCRC